MRRTLILAPLVLAISCSERPGGHYKTAEEARAALDAGGWWPRAMPAAAFGIREAHDLDTNAQKIAFAIPKDACRSFKGRPATHAPVNAVPGLSIQGWPAWLTGRPEPAAVIDRGAFMFVDERGVLILRCDESAAGEGYYWSSGLREEAEVAAADVDVTPLSNLHGGVFVRWQQRHLGWRRAFPGDCLGEFVETRGRNPCDEMMDRFRTWAGDPAANPYYAAGDFNRDGKDDFAVVVTQHQRPPSGRTAKLLVFNGPFDESRYFDSVFGVSRHSLAEAVIRYGPPMPQPWRLTLGMRPAGEEVLVPQGGTYVLR